MPIGFQGALTDATFTLFAFTLAGAVTISGVVALTLSPMRCSKVFRSQQAEGRFTHFLDRPFGRLRAERRDKRRGGVKVPLHDELVWVATMPSAELLDLDRALQELREIDARKSRMMELRLFLGPHSRGNRRTIADIPGHRELRA